MEKANVSFIEPVGEVNLHSPKWDLGKGLRKIQFMLESFFIKKGYLLVLVGFLLGRALILAKLTPFCLPFFASVYLIKRDRAPLALIGLIVGAVTISLTNAAFTFIVTVSFIIIFRISKKWLKSEMKAMPFFVGIVLGL